MNAAELLPLVREGAKVAEGAAKVLDDLLTLYKAEDDARGLARLHPPVQPENSGEPESSVVVWGNVNRQTVTGGPRRGDIESTLRYLISLGPGTEVGEVGEGAA